MRRKRFVRGILVPALLLAAAAPALAQSGARCHQGKSFQQWLQGFEQEAIAQGVSRQTIAAASPYLTFDPGIVRRDHGQSVFQQSFLQFANRMVQSRMSSGPAQMRKYAGILGQVERKYGVSAAVLTSFWALETDFGANNGNLPVLRSVVTLAYDCRRPEMFHDELMGALKVIQRGDITAAEFVGAWAGEIGPTQFSPAAYFKYGVDFDGDGRIDLINSVPDVLASTANLLAQSGWKRGEPWLQEVRVPANLPWEEADLAIKHPRSQWVKWGVTAAHGTLPSDAMPASLLLLMGRGGPAFLAYKNFDVFLEWNKSLVYATTAAYFATRLSGAPQVSRGPSPPANLSGAQIKELQQLLARHGYEAGTIDGKLGLATRKGIKQAQLKLGLPADAYPTAELITRLRTAH